MHEALALLAEGDAPVLASPHDAVAGAGAGMSLALGADFAIASDDTKLNLAYARIGASVDGGGSWHLPRIVGLRRALEIALLCDSLDALAAPAPALGLVNRVVPASEREAETLALARRLAQGPTRAFSRVRRLLRGSQQRSLVEQLAAELGAFVKGPRTGDFAEGLNAFFAKRAPRYTGR